MNQPWDPETPVDLELARTLIAEQFPSLSTVEIRPISGGWDNTAYIVGNAWVFRFPQRALAYSCMENEIKILPEIEESLTVPISNPVYIGGPSERFPHWFSGSALIPGEPSDPDIPLTDSVASTLGRFLGGLHSLEPPTGIEDDQLRRTDLAQRVGSIEELLGPELEIPTDLVRAKMTELARYSAWQGPGRIVHGDLYSRHLMMENGELTGIIDWGDIHRGDPALDLSIGFSCFLPGQRAVLFAEYGEVDHATLCRARFRAIHYGVILTHYGKKTGQEMLERCGRKALELALSDL